MKIKPKCMIKPASKNDNNYIDHQYLGHSAKGFILPCCWCDIPNPKSDDEINKLFKEKLHIDNNDSIEEIVLSDEWISFLSTLIDNPSKASKVCKKYCSVENKMNVIKKVTIHSKDKVKDFKK